MRVDLITREYPPHVYGGAGVHVAELARVLRGAADVRVHCFDGPRPGEPGVHGYDEPAELAGANAALRTFGVDLAMVAGVQGADLVHSHTWYANLAGHLAALLDDRDGMEELGGAARRFVEERIGATGRIIGSLRHRGLLPPAGLSAVERTEPGG